MNAEHQDKDSSSERVSSGAGGKGAGAALRTRFLYFYHVSRDGILAYLVERANAIDHTDIRAVISDVFDDIRAGVLHPAGWGLGDLRWRQKSLFVVFFEHPNQEITGVTFDYRPHGGNHTFFGQTVIGKADSGFQDASIFYCFNHQKKRGGGDLTAEDLETFDIHLLHPHAEKARLGHTDTGTNTGPPHQP